jgi:serine/threonine-protein kinase
MKRLHDGLVVGDRYRLNTRIASGGMGDVWEAFDEVLHRVVAVKVMRPSVDEGAFAVRFKAEARHAARLGHPNIAAVYDYGEHHELAYLVMELVVGEPLSAVLRREGRLPAVRVRELIGQAALALATAHDAGVIHRDVKPANFIIRADGTLKLTDFGISRALDGSGQTRTGEVMGTPFYLSPEQAMGKPATEASDIYALGVVAHEMLSGSRPFDGGTPVATALAHISEPAPPLPGDVPADLVALVRECLAKDPAQRPDSARSVAERLGQRDRAGGTDPALRAIGEESQDGIPAVPAAVVEQTPTGAWSPAWTTSLAPLRDLETILAALDPRLNPGRYAVVSVSQPVEGARPFMTIVEPEGLTMLLTVEEAERLDLAFELPLAWITLGAVRAIGAMGLVPTVTTALAQARIPSVAGVGRWHTHLFVPEVDADRAMKVLSRLSMAHQEI